MGAAKTNIEGVQSLNVGFENCDTNKGRLCNLLEAHQFFSTFTLDRAKVLSGRDKYHKIQQRYLDANDYINHQREITKLQSIKFFLWDIVIVLLIKLLIKLLAKSRKHGHHKAGGGITPPKLDMRLVKKE